MEDKIVFLLLPSHKIVRLGWNTNLVISFLVVVGFILVCVKA